MANYRTLESQRKEFRLVDVHPAKHLTSLVSCTLRHERLDGKRSPHFETISYVWGDATRRATMEVHGVEVDVPASTVDALRRMRLKDNPRTLWIDALCINQSDVNERSEQVKIMGEIYKNSQGNLIYLGEVIDPEQTEAALADIEAIISEMNMETKNLTEVQDTVFDPWREDPKLADSGLQVEIHGDLMEKEIFSLPWFRLWVFQEAALAPKNTCVLGWYTLDLLSIARAAHWIAHKQYFVSRSLFLNDGRGIASALFDYVDKTHGVVATGAQGTVTFAQLMSDTWDLRATDPRDQVYATLGLREWPDGIHELLTPDYNKSEEQVFRDASRFSLQTPGEHGVSGLQNLDALQEDLEKDEFVSWAIFPSRQYDPEKDPKILQEELFRCGKDEEQNWDVDRPARVANFSTLDVIGIQLGRIETMSPTLTRGMVKDIRAVGNWLGEVTAMLQGANSATREALASVLVAGSVMERELSSEDDHSSLYDLHQTLQNLGRVSVPSDEPFSLDRLIDERHGNKSGTGRYSAAFQRACVNRRVFCTVNGYLGVGSNLLQEGDVVAVFYGAELPFMLRPCAPDQHQILGPCYVHGVMFGEAVHQHRESAADSFLFRIR